jgi:hypothetical protein
MEYEFTLNKKKEFHTGKFSSTDEAFESAVYCSADAISSIIDDKNLTIKCNPPKITICSNSGLLPFTLEECKNKVKSAFCDENGKLYPEYSKVDIFQKIL